MRHWLLAAALASPWSASALAADLGPYSPPPAETYYEPGPRAMPGLWQGMYIGANVGTAWGYDSDVTLSGPGASGAFSAFEPDGWYGGGQIGYNAQFNALVLGIEADLQGSDISDSAAGFAGGGGGYFAQSNMSIDWFSTLRGRVGFAAGPALLYATGGLAFADVNRSLTASNGVNTVSMSDDSIETGYTVGGGVEWAFAPNWSLKSEYLYVDLGDQTLSGSSPGGNFSSTTDADFHTVRVGVNYHF